MIKLGPYKDFRDIPQFTREAPYAVDADWGYFIRHWVEGKEFSDDTPLELCPDFQRGHVWTEAQQIAYVEYALRGGKSGRDIYFNCSTWMGDFNTPLQLVDGLQRVTAVRRFMNNEIPAFGTMFKEYGGQLRVLSGNSGSFKVHVNTLKTRAEVLTWYLEMNSGGTPHSQAELDRVMNLLKEELK
jgi:hypothetical protein